MKVKEVVAKLSKCDQELEAAYEHCYIDYVQERKDEGIVEMGGLRAIGYSRWIPITKREPEEGDFPCLLAMYLPGGWDYFLIKDHNLLRYTKEEIKKTGYWMPVSRTPEDLDQLLKGKKDGE